MCGLPGAFCFAASVRDTPACPLLLQLSPAPTLALHSDLSGQSQSRVNYCPEMPTVPSYLNTKDTFKKREINSQQMPHA